MLSFPMNFAFGPTDAHLSALPFDAQPLTLDFPATANPFQFNALHTLSPDGNSLPLSFHQLTHTFLSHGTGPSPAPGLPSFYSPIFTSLSAKFFSYRTCKKRVRNLFGCRTYKNKGLITLVFAALTKITGCPDPIPTLELAPPLLPFPLGVTLPQFAQRGHRGGRSQRSLSTQTRAARILRTLTSEWRILWPPLPPRLSPM